MLSITTDYLKDSGDPTPYLKRIADAGFSHVHWCHQWYTDFLYSEHEIAHIKKTLNNFSLQLLDLHASNGKEKNWCSNIEHQRLAGVELVKNRIHMACELGSDVIIMHATEYSEPLIRSLDELMLYAKERDVRIALENLDTIYFDIVAKAFDDYAPDYIGLCYDSGHGNFPGANGPAMLDKFKNRLISVHLHDNDSTKDQHKPLFSGTIDWEHLAAIIAESIYTKPLSMEVSMHNSGFIDEKCFLADCFKKGNIFSEMVQKKRKRFNG